MVIFPLLNTFCCFPLLWYHSLNLPHIDCILLLKTDTQTSIYSSIISVCPLWSYLIYFLYLVIPYICLHTIEDWSNLLGPIAFLLRIIFCYLEFWSVLYLFILFFLFLTYITLIGHSASPRCAWTIKPCILKLEDTFVWIHELFKSLVTTIPTLTLFTITTHHDLNVFPSFSILYWFSRLLIFHSDHFWTRIGLVK